MCHAYPFSVFMSTQQWWKVNKSIMSILSLCIEEKYGLQKPGRPKFSVYIHTYINLVQFYFSLLGVGKVK